MCHVTSSTASTRRQDFCCVTTCSRGIPTSSTRAIRDFAATITLPFFLSRSRTTATDHSLLARLAKLARGERRLAAAFRLCPVQVESQLATPPRQHHPIMRKTRVSIFRDIYYQPYDDCTRLKLYSSSKGNPPPSSNRRADSTDFAQLVPLNCICRVLFYFILFTLPLSVLSIPLSTRDKTNGINHLYLI